MQLLWQFCRENNKQIVRKAAGRLEHPFLLLGERQEEALHDQGHQLKHCPCPKCGLSLLHLFLKAGQASTNSPAPPACPLWPGRAAAPATPPGPEPGLAGSLPAQLPGQPLPVGPVLLFPVLPLSIFLKKCYQTSKLSFIAS